MAEKTDAPTRTAERELVITRVFDVPRELVWKAWSARDHVLKWLGPKDFTAVDFELEPRPGAVDPPPAALHSQHVHAGLGLDLEFLERVPVGSGAPLHDGLGGTVRVRISLWRLHRRGSSRSA